MAGRSRAHALPLPLRDPPMSYNLYGHPPPRTSFTGQQPAVVLPLHPHPLVSRDDPRRCDDPRHCLPVDPPVAIRSLGSLLAAQDRAIQDLLLIDTLRLTAKLVPLRQDLSAAERALLIPATVSAEAHDGLVAEDRVLSGQMATAETVDHGVAMMCEELVIVLSFGALGADEAEIVGLLRGQPRGHGRDGCEVSPELMFRAESTVLLCERQMGKAAVDFVERSHAGIFGT